MMANMSLAEGQLQEMSKMISDCHMHTNFSPDADRGATPEVMIKGALEKGLKRICFTDHYDLDFPFETTNGDMTKNEFLFDLNEYFAVLEDLKEKYKDRIDIRIGVEFGLQRHLGTSYRKIAQEYPFDYIIGSGHVFGGIDPYYTKDTDGRPDQMRYKEAFIEMLDYIKAVEDFDSLGHLDYIVRYGREQQKFYSYRQFTDEIDEILKYLIAHGKALELNMAGVKYGLGFAHPHPDILKRYKELGGEMVTVGSDAHRPKHIAYAYEKAGEILKECGFGYYTEFIKRKPQSIQIA